MKVIENEKEVAREIALAKWIDFKITKAVQMNAFGMMSVKQRERALRLIRKSLNKFSPMNYKKYVGQQPSHQGPMKCVGDYACFKGNGNGKVRYKGSEENYQTDWPNL